MPTGNARREAAYAAAEHFNRRDLDGNTPIGLFTKHPDKPRIGLILGSGWGDAIDFDPLHERPLSTIQGFEALAALNPIAGHPRLIQLAEIADHDVIVLHGRIHLNEAPNNPDVARMARLQIEMLDCLGVNVLIATCAVGSLSRVFSVGDIAIINGLITLFAPDMPLWGGEFCSPEDALDTPLSLIALDSSGFGLSVSTAAYAMVRGPQFEGRKHDKGILREAGGDVVGMSILPEACIAALYNMRMLALGFVTNSPSETHDHETNVARVKAASQQLAGYLNRIITRI